MNETREKSEQISQDFNLRERAWKLARERYNEYLMKCFDFKNKHPTLKDKVRYQDFIGNVLQSCVAVLGNHEDPDRDRNEDDNGSLQTVNQLFTWLGRYLDLLEKNPAALRHELDSRQEGEPFLGREDYLLMLENLKEQ
ncbi:MAG: hypothetical protein M1383_01805 [Patescibacteria group bacterium]|nr:hypothetical protein [Patescibacteria group bacterium]